MQPQGKFDEATKNTLLHIAELSHNWLAEARKQVLHPQTLSPTNPLTHKPFYPQMFWRDGLKLQATPSNHTGA
jgi:hypothetical protein